VAALLGITLMLRIRNCKNLTIYRQDKQTVFTHIASLFSGMIDWDLIRTHLPDMLRVALSMTAGRITPSILLRKVGTYRKKNRL
jgi:TnpA family transposase